MPRPLFIPRKRPGINCTGGWVDPRAGVDRCGKSRLPPGFDPRTVQPVASRYTDYATRPTKNTVGTSKTIAQRTRVCVEHSSTWSLFAAECMLLLHLPSLSSESRTEFGLKSAVTCGSNCSCVLSYYVIGTSCISCPSLSGFLYGAA